ncbi:UDP-phosphate alpha N-acetylglucosaminyltransferase [Shinella daejeonensis]|uniref:UDP-phosphate alpha N-acetylglucosaminyltransferase n=1 Tax=Shinella daejeonensis TaxID=659017 RepID=UPI0020C78082|nr:UDP-phosphate alpha N-acetylglucosaminyltransferase [Shinella daejeonensis]MCP8896613.1 UDP-phosphate alpha N-acetylglucosaminyltransferase [Shinella daejeonensis]
MTYASPAGRLDLAMARDTPAAAAARLVATFAVIGGLVFNAGLCFVNTRVMGISESHVMMAEMVIVAAAFLAAMTRRSALYLLVAVFVSYMMLLFMLRGGQINLKSLRDILIPFAFFFLGRRIADPRVGDRLVMVSAVIVVAFGLFEYLFLETFLDYFNVIGYYLARGSVSLKQTYGETRGLFISGERPEARTILPFLGQHRVSSVFLEPVSMGNFAVVIYSWALFRGRAFAGRFLVFALAFAVVALADARFGLYTCLLATLLYPVYRFLPRLLWGVLPFLLLAVLAIYGITSVEGGGPNDISGRFAVTAHILTQLSPGVVFGVETTDIFVADSGLAYSLTAFGLFGFIALWMLFVHTPFADAKAWRFHSMMIVYLLLLMLISDSFYSIKTAALLWFLLGVSAVVRWSDRPG